MMMKKKSALAMAVLCACMSVGFVAEVSAEDTMKHDMNEVVVEGEKDTLPGGFIVDENRVGILGDIPVLEVPFTQRNYSEKTIENFADPNQPLNGVLSSNPSIRVGSSSPMYTDFSMRGVNMNGSHYYLNGVPNMFNQTRSLPTYVLDSIDIVSGPNTVLNGATFSNNGVGDGSAPAGMINSTTKKATVKDINNYTQRFSGQSTWTEELDLGRRFGDNAEWGVRVNVHQENGELAIDGAEVEDSSIYFNIDHQDEKSTTNLFGGYYDWEVEGGQRWIGTYYYDKPGNIIDAVDGSTDMSFEGQMKRNHGYVMTLNHKQTLNEDWEAFFNAGYGHYNEEKIDPWYGSLYIWNDGKVTGDFRHYKSESKSLYGQMGVKNKFENDFVKNTMSFAVDYFKYESRAVNTGGKDGQAKLEGDIWNGMHVVGTPIYCGSLKARNFSEENAVAMTLADRAEFGKLSTLVALQYKDTETINSSKTKKVSKDGINPSFAIAYKPEANISIYGSYAESYTKPIEVSGGYTNDGDIFDPIQNHQYEIGVKYDNADMLHSLAIFDLNQGSYIDIINDDGSYTYSHEGETRYKGVEYSLTGKITDKWSVMGGIMYLDANYERMSDYSSSKAKEGKRVYAVPKWNTALAFEYEADANNSVLAKMNYSGSSYANKYGTKLPDYVTFDLGYTHKTQLGETPVTLRAMCYNLLNEKYWCSSLCLGAPRTYMVSAEFEI